MGGRSAAAVWWDRAADTSPSEVGSRGGRAEPRRDCVMCSDGVPTMAEGQVGRGHAVLDNFAAARVLAWASAGDHYPGHRGLGPVEETEAGEPRASEWFEGGMPAAASGMRGSPASRRSLARRSHNQPR